MATVRDRFHEALALHKSGRTSSAERICRELLRNDPAHAGVWHLLGLVLHSRGDLAGALEHVRKAIALSGHKAVYWNNYGAVLRDWGRFAEATAAFQRALQLRDEYPDAWSNLGLMQAEKGALDEAERSLRYALRLEPRHADALRHLAMIYREKGDLEEALRLCRDALSVTPEKSAAYDAQASVLAAMRRFEEARQSYRKAVAIDPKSADSHLSLGLVCADLDESAEARKAFDRAAALRPDRPMWQLRHLSLCPVVFHSQEQILAYRTELERQLDEALAHRPAFDWRNALRDGFTPSFQLAHHMFSSRRLKEKVARLFAPGFPQGRPRRANLGKIRVGFACTRSHEGGFVRGFGGIMKRLSVKHFEVVGLVSRTILPFCRNAVSSENIQWVGFPHDLAGALEVIQQTRCHVIVHWHAGTDVINYFLPFLPLAPVQCIGFGANGTTGIANIDYFISSRLFERDDDAAEDYTERLVCFQGLTAWQERPRVCSAATRAELGLPGSGALYFCPQQLVKFHPAFDRLLSQILEKDRHGRVVLLAGHRPHAAEALRSRFENTLGKSLVKRVSLLSSRRPLEYYRLMSAMDVVLDSPAYSASLTGYDAFAFGIPVVTMPGKYMVQRYAQGFYKRMGIRELIVSTEEEYVELAVRLGGDADFRAFIRRTILDRCGVLYEDPSVVREYEHFFAGNELLGRVSGKADHRTADV